MAKYKAWIPNITGKLSFSQIGLSDDSKVSTNVFNSVDLTGKIVAKQQRTSNDGPIPPWLQRLTSTRDPRQIFIINAKVVPGYLLSEKLEKTRPGWHLDNKAVLKGSVFVYIPSPWVIECIHPSVIKKKLKIFQKNFTYAQTGLLDGDEFLNTDHVKDFVGAAGDFDNWYNCEFEINRSGECTLDILNFGILTTENSCEILRSYANQVFFCLRDMIHRHYHHDTNEELLGIVFPTKTSVSNYDDSTWRRETLYGLMRLALQARRNQNIGDSKNAIGIIAYAKSFQSLLSYWKYEKEHQISSLPSANLIRDFAPYDFDSMLASLKAGISQAEWNRSRKMTFVAISIAFLAVMITVTFSLIRLRLLLSDENSISYLPEYVIFISSEVSKYPLFTMVFLPMFIVVFFAIWVFDFKWKKDSSIRIHRLENAILNEMNNKIKRPILSWIIIIVLNLLVVFLLFSTTYWALKNFI